jgi:hypothetical protein
VALINARMVAAGALAVLLSSACAGPAPVASPDGRVVATLSQQGVRVDMRWSSAGGGEPVLAVTFTPLRPGFHLYSVDLPPDGVQGVGRPSRVEVGGGLTATGPPAVDRLAAPLLVAGLDAPVPVYPDGPITVSLPARLTSGRPPLAWVSYAACSSSTCLPPVTHAPLDPAIPGSA